MNLLIVTIEYLTWFAIGLLPILFIVLIQNLIGFLLISRIMNGRISRPVFYITAAAGVPIHELSHALMAVIFGHRIILIRFFEFTRQHGRLGFVEHQWNRHSLYQSIGLFFIGIAPLIGATLVIYGASAFLLPDMLEEFSGGLLASTSHYSGEAVTGSIKAILWGVTNAFSAILVVQEPPMFWLWLLITSTVALHATPSRADLKSCARGAILISLILTGLTVIAGEFYPVQQWIVAYWVQGISLIAVTIVLSMPWWIVLSILVAIDKEIPS